MLPRRRLISPSVSASSSSIPLPPPDTFSIPPSDLPVSPGDIRRVLLCMMVLSGLISLLLVVSANAAQIPLRSEHGKPLKHFGVSDDPKHAAEKTYDYVVVGGGLTGLAVAMRLAEHPSTTVLVLEAGQDDRFDQRVRNVNQYREIFKKDNGITWTWQTDHGRNITGGKTLGGSSSISGTAWTRGLADQYDVWGHLLEKSEQDLNWNWDDLVWWMKKAEEWSEPNDHQRKNGADGIWDYHGHEGPIKVTFPDHMYNGPQQGYFANSIQRLTGIKRCLDVNGGQPNCVSFTPNTLDWMDHDVRSSSAHSYLYPLEHARNNWLTLVNHQAEVLLWSDDDDEKRVTGVQFQTTSDGFYGLRHRVHARKEVILAAGAINTPALLQRSGVGNPHHLESLGIPIKIDLPTVGKNLQEQTSNSLGATGSGYNKGGEGPSDVIAYPNIYELFGSEAVDVVEAIKQNISAWAEQQAENALNKEALLKIYKHQANMIIHREAPVVELAFDNEFPDDLGINLWTLLPFSRGRVEIESMSAWHQPKIHVNYFSTDIDKQIQVAAARLGRKLFQTYPLSSLSAGETHPGIGRSSEDWRKDWPRLPLDATDDMWMEWIWEHFSAANQPIGTCAMMRKDLGGVVDGRLRLYGAENVRIVDASIVPMQISGRLASTLYGIAEKAADFIKSDI